jgi:hypothetical protein
MPLQSLWILDTFYPMIRALNSPDPFRLCGIRHSLNGSGLNVERMCSRFQDELSQLMGDENDKRGLNFQGF